MEFYGRQTELAVLERTRIAAQKGPARMTIVTGRRRVGKTTLIQRSVRNQVALYFFVTQTTEAQLCERFTQAASQVLNLFLPTGIQNFSDLFEALMLFSKERHFTLVIDEFQNFATVNPAIFSCLQDTWDRLKDTSRMHLILSGSSYSMMYRIFEDAHQPLFGRATTKLRAKPFSPSDLKEALAQAAPDYRKDDLLALYTFTGGVPFYVADLLDNGAVTLPKIVDWMLSPGTIYKVEGRDLLRLEIGEGSNRYQAIMTAIALGATKYADIETRSGLKNISPYLERLEFCGFIERRRPILAKPLTKSSRWVIKDTFLRFWCRFIAADEGLLEAGFTASTAEKILADYPTFSGPMLERWFREALMETGRYRQVGAWWDTASGAGGAQNEVDIVALGVSRQSAYVAEVKRQRKAFREKEFLEKVDHLRKTILHGMQVETGLLTLSDM